MQQSKQIEIVRSKEEEALDRLTDAVLERLQVREASKPETDEELAESVLPQPWMLPRHITNAIRELVPMTHWQKWDDVYQQYGCFKCERTNVPHQSLGLCAGCYSMLMSRAKAAIVKRAEKQGARPTAAEMKAQLTSGQDSAKRILAKMGVVTAAPLPPRGLPPAKPFPKPVTTEPNPDNPPRKPNE
jgi:hypothetical protein